MSRAGASVGRRVPRRRRGGTTGPSDPVDGRLHQLARRPPARASTAGQARVAVAGEVAVDLGGRGHAQGPHRPQGRAVRTASVSVSVRGRRVGRQAALDQVPPPGAARRGATPAPRPCCESTSSSERHAPLVAPPAARPTAPGRRPRRSWVRSGPSALELVEQRPRRRRRWPPATRAPAGCARAPLRSVTRCMRNRCRGRSEVRHQRRGVGPVLEQRPGRPPAGRRRVSGSKRPTRLQTTSRWERATTEMGSSCRQPSRRTSSSSSAGSRPGRGPASRWPRYASRRAWTGQSQRCVTRVRRRQPGPSMVPHSRRVHGRPSAWRATASAAALAASTSPR